MLLRTIKFIIIISSSILLFSCSDDIKLVEEDVDDFSGIEYTTTRSGGNANGVGFACNFSDLFANDIFEGFEGDQNLYAIIAGDSIDIDDNFLFSPGVSFRVFWVEDGEVSPGTYEAFGMSLNIENPENLEENVTSSFAQDVEVQLTEVSEDQMIGTFSGTFQSMDDEIQETITGKFNVERKSCN